MISVFHAQTFGGFFYSTKNRLPAPQAGTLGNPPHLFPPNTNHDNIHVRGYKEKGDINTPMELAIQNQLDRFTLAIDAIDRVPSLKVRGSHAREALLNQQLDCRHYAYEEGIDPPEIVN
jgi:phosphoketolase